MSDSVYQTAKISKLLLLVAEGRVENFKGKNLDGIDVELSPIEEKMWNFTRCTWKKEEEYIVRESLKEQLGQTNRNALSTNILLNTLNEKIPWYKEKCKNSSKIILICLKTESERL